MTQDPRASLRPPRTLRAVLISANIALHIAVHDLVTGINAARPASVFRDLALPIDGQIPYVAWTWVIYYFGDLYILFWGSYVVWKLPSRQFSRAVVAYTVMILVGAAIHLAFPGRSPWPEEGAAVQHWFHEQITYDRNVCLPSMHVALTLLPTCMTFHLFRSRGVRIVVSIAALLISASTVTLKEHFVLDVIAGTVLALVVYAVWRRPDRSAVRESTAEQGS
jgi:membrane-associated phospholipid phosphatase